ncbi:hypothetical protein HO133_007741 [Letharia lupina]|uniref:RING-type domain-containing protein n=1 Tax=Letharia lupina TaxID=560253 RepID=A0A8H6CR23_9LECA|nr:uncharacterized protein HO133_007741 [Letharia lupina]KAF6228013.1 hypothetical protein HO133_007741 [Letharia lupina]
MAEEFLAQLRYVRRGVLEKGDQRCFICMEDYGTTPSENGTIERAVILPCNHIMGSECISTWLSPRAQGGAGNNTCPVCRHVLFRRVQRPPIPQPNDAEHMRIHTVLVNRCVGLSAQLGLNHMPEIAGMARWIANHIHDIFAFEMIERENDDRFVRSVAAASIYMASHLLGDGRSLEMIESCALSGDDPIRSAYALLYLHRYDIINTQLLARVGMGLGSIGDVLPPALP